MVYCVIHKFGSLLVGPNVILPGTKLEKFPPELPKGIDLT